MNTSWDVNASALITALHRSKQCVKGRGGGGHEHAGRCEADDVVVLSLPSGLIWIEVQDNTHEPGTAQTLSLTKHGEQGWSTLYYWCTGRNNSVHVRALQVCEHGSVSECCLFVCASLIRLWGKGRIRCLKNHWERDGYYRLILVSTKMCVCGFFCSW